MGSLRPALLSLPYITNIYSCPCFLPFDPQTSILPSPNSHPSIHLIPHPFSLPPNLPFNPNPSSLPKLTFLANILCHSNIPSIAKFSSLLNLPFFPDRPSHPNHSSFLTVPSLSNLPSLPNFLPFPIFLLFPIFLFFSIFPLPLLLLLFYLCFHFNLPVLHNLASIPLLRFALLCFAFLSLHFLYFPFSPMSVPSPHFPILLPSQFSTLLNISLLIYLPFLINLPPVHDLPSFSSLSFALLCFPFISLKFFLSSIVSLLFSLPLPFHLFPFLSFLPFPFLLFPTSPVIHPSHSILPIYLQMFSTFLHLSSRTKQRLHTFRMHTAKQDFIYYFYFTLK